MPEKEDSMGTSVVAAPRSYRWNEVWSKIYFHPSDNSFLDILSDPTAKAGRAYLWVAVMAVIIAILDAVVGAFTANDFRLGCFISQIVGAVIGLAIGTAIPHLVAKLVGGTGAFSQLVYSFGAVQAPYVLGTWFLDLYNKLGRPGLTGGEISPGLIITFVLLPLGLAWSIYAFILDIIAIRAVERISTGRALIVAFFPVILVLILLLILLIVGVLPTILGNLGLQ
jgi:hypothetical protein